MHESILDQRVLDLSAYERLNGTFMQLLLAGRDHVVFTDALAGEVGNPVVLEDATAGGRLFGKLHDRRRSVQRVGKAFPNRA